MPNQPSVQAFSSRSHDLARGEECVLEAGVETAGGGILKVVGGGRNRGKLRNMAQYSQSKKREDAGAVKIRAGTGIKG